MTLSHMGGKNFYEELEEKLLNSRKTNERKKDLSPTLVHYNYWQRSLRKK